MISTTYQLDSKWQRDKKKKKIITFSESLKDEIDNLYFRLRLNFHRFDKLLTVVLKLRNPL